MSGKLFGQIVLLIVIGALVMMAMKCTMKKCHMMGKKMSYRSCPTCSVSK
jgi:hypothetical protein